jgi:putative endonuclease
VRTPFGEIDIAALQQGVLVVVEVKARRSLEAGLQAVGPHQQGRLARAALALAGRLGLTGAPIRFDVVVIGAGLWPIHLRSAFDGRET